MLGIYHLKKLFSDEIEFTTEYQNTDIYIIAVPTPYITAREHNSHEYFNWASGSRLIMIIAHRRENPE